MTDAMNNVIEKYLNDTLEFSPDEEEYREQYELALKYCDLVADIEEKDAKLKWEKSHTLAKEEAEQKRYEADKKQSYDQWIAEYRQKAEIAKQELTLKQCEVHTKEKSNRIGLISAIGGVLVGIGSVAGGIYLGTKGLQTDRDGYNESPGTLKQAESITASSTKYL